MFVLAENKRIKIKSILEIGSAIFRAEDYDMLKELFKKMIDKQNEKIVLKKI